MKHELSTLKLSLNSFSIINSFNHLTDENKCIFENCSENVRTKSFQHKKICRLFLASKRHKIINYPKSQFHLTYPNLMFYLDKPN